MTVENNGDQWLRQTVGNLIVGTVTAVNSASDLDSGAIDASQSGLTATGSDAQIHLNVATGSLTIVNDVTAVDTNAANGTQGTIDLRTGGTGNDIAINGATLKSGAVGLGAGTVQVIASGNISTTTNNDTTDEIATTGNVLLVSGVQNGQSGQIGADGNRIEISGVNTLAAQSAGSQWIRQTSGDLTVGRVTALTPTDNVLDNEAFTKDGLVATAGNINLNTNAGSLTISKDVVAGNSGTVDLSAVGAGSDI
jgi:hypothetical protein